MASSQSSLVTATSFIFLALLRGSTPLMAYLAVSNLDSSGLVVAWKSAITLVFFAAMLVALYCTDGELRMQFMANFKSRDTYWKLPLVGLLQTAAPYLLVVYSLKCLPPTLVGVFMTATPWFTIIFERLPFVKIKSTVNSYVKIGMFIGFSATILIMSPIIHESLGNGNSGSNISQSSKNATAMHDKCRRPNEILKGTLALVSGSIFWAVSSVFWRSKRGNIHYVFSSVGQNLTALFVGVICWAIFDIDKPTENSVWFEWKTVFGLAFLGIGTGWVATILVHYLSKKIGPMPTNQVLVFLPIIAFIEDCIFVQSVVQFHDSLIGLVVLGILMLSVAAFLTNLPGTRNKDSNPYLSEHLIQSDHLSQTDGNFRDMQDEINKYQRCSSVSEDDSSAKEEEISVLSSASSYPPLRQIVGDDLNKTATLKDYETYDNT